MSKWKNHPVKPPHVSVVSEKRHNQSIGGGGVLSVQLIRVNKFMCIVSAPLQSPTPYIWDLTLSQTAPQGDLRLGE